MKTGKKLKAFGPKGGFGKMKGFKKLNLTFDRSLELTF